MAREQALEICKNIQKTLDKGNKSTVTKFNNPMFDKPNVHHQGILQRKLKRLLKEYNINKKEL